MDGSFGSQREPVSCVGWRLDSAARTTATCLRHAHTVIGRVGRRSAVPATRVPAQINPFGRGAGGRAGDQLPPISADQARPLYWNPVAFRHNVAVSELPSTGMRGNMARRIDGGARNALTGGDSSVNMVAIAAIR